MAFVSVGQKYGFVSAGDVFRRRLAEANEEVEKARKEASDAKKLVKQVDEERRMTDDHLKKAEENLKKVEDDLKKAEEEKLETARGLYEDGVSLEALVRRFNLTKEQIRGK